MSSKNPWLQKNIPYEWDTNVNADEIIQALEIKKTDKVLDIGCGPGSFLQDIYNKTKAKCYGVDIRTDLFKQNNNKNIKLKYSDMEHLQFPDKFFDKVFSIGVLEHSPNTDRVFGEASRVLKNKGKLHFFVPNKISFFHLTKKLKQFLGKWFLGYEASFTIKKLDKILARNHLDIESSGIVSHSRVSNPLNYLDNLLNKINPKIFGFFIIITAQKNE